MKSYDHKTALITGGSSGIGLALARQLAAQGAHVAIVGRNASRLSAACEEITAARLRPDQRVDTLPVDVSDADETCRTLTDYARQFGAPDLLINSAGITRPGYFHEIELEDFRSMMEVNYFGTLHVIKALLPYMMKRRSGHIVNISSVAGFMGVYGYSAYGPSKFAIRGLSDSLHYELAEYNIRVSVVFPPDTQTPQLEQEAAYKPPVLVELDKSNKVMSAGAVAEAILKGVSRGNYVITPGFDSWLYYGLTNFFGLVYPVMNWMVVQSRRASGVSGKGPAEDGSAE